MSDKPRRRNRFGRLFKVLGGLLILLVIFIALLPTLISWGLGRGLITGAIEGSVNGKAEIGGLSLGWFSGQQVEGLTIVSDDGDTTIDGTATIDRGLLGLITDSSNLGTITLKGDIAGVRYADGTTSFEKLIKPSDEPSTFDISTLRANLRIEGVSLRLADKASGEEIAMRDLTGSVDLDLRNATSIDLAAATSVGGTAGSLDIDGVLTSLLAPGGAFNRSGAKADLTVAVMSFPLSLAESILAMPNRITSIAGPMLDEATIRVNGSLDEAAAEFSLAAAHLAAGGRVEVRDGAATVSESQPVTLRIDARDEILGAWIADESVASMGLTTRPTLTAMSGDSPAFVEVRIDRASVAVPESGGVNLAGASFNAAITGGGFRLNMPDHPDVQSIDLSRFELRASGEDVTKSLTLTADLGAGVNAYAPTTLTADLTATDLVTAAGAVTFDPAKLTGAIEGRNLPMVMAQRFVENTPLKIERDLGPTADVAATFSAGETREIVFTVAAENLNGRLEAAVGADGGIVGRVFTLSTDLRPRLVAAFAQDRALTLPRHLELNVTEFSVPAPREGAGFDALAAAVRGRLALTGESITVRGAETSPIAISTVDFSFATPQANREITLTGRVVAEGVQVDVNESVTGLFGPDGAITAMAAVPVGTITVANLTPEVVARFAPDLPPVVAEALNGALGLTIETTTDGADLIATVNIESPGVGAAIVARRTAEAVLLESGTVRTAVTPALLAALQSTPAEEGATPPGGSAPPAAPMEISSERVTLVLKPTKLMSRSVDTYAFDPGPIAGDLAVSDIRVVNAPGVAPGEVLLLRRIEAAVNATLGEQMSVGVVGSALARADARQRKIADVAYNLAVTENPTTGEFMPVVSMDATEVDVAMLEPLLGHAPGTLRDWLGDGGTLKVETSLAPEGMTALLSPAFPNLTGVFRARSDAENLTVTSDTSTIILTAGAIAGMLNRPRVEGEPAPAARFSVAEDVPLNLLIKSLTVPSAILSGEPLDRTAVAVDISLEPAKPVAITRIDAASGEAETVTFQRWGLTITCTDLATGPVVAMSGVVRAAADQADRAGDSAPGDRAVMDLRIAMRRLIDDQRRFVIEGGAVDLDLSVKKFPTWVADAFTGNETLLQDALGPTIGAEVQGRGVSSTSGRLTASIKSENKSFLDSALAIGQTRIGLQRDKPTTAGLTWNENLRRRLLYKVHSIFADIRTVDEQIEVEVRNASFPSDGDISRFSADLTIRVGSVQLESGSQFLKIMQYVNTSERDTIPGHVGDLNIKIRNGVLAYEDFVIQVGGREGAYKNRLVFAGNVDLAKNHVNALIGAYPVNELRNSIEEFAIVPEGVTVGIKFSGDLYDDKGLPKALSFEPVIDIKFEDIIKQQIRDRLPGLGDIFGGGGG